LPDSGALRVRRSRAHKAGDHSLCRRCAAVRSGLPTQLPAPVPDLPSDLPSGPAFDPQAELQALATRMAQAHREDPSNAILGAELRKTLVELMPKRAEKPDDDLAGLFAEFGAS
jgi:hypothetical protein